MAAATAEIPWKEERRRRQKAGSEPLPRSQDDPGRGYNPGKVLPAAWKRPITPATSRLNPEGSRFVFEEIVEVSSTSPRGRENVRGCRADMLVTRGALELARFDSCDTGADTAAALLNPRLLLSLGDFLAWSVASQLSDRIGAADVAENPTSAGLRVRREVLQRTQRSAAVFASEIGALGWISARCCYLLRRCVRTSIAYSQIR